MLSEMYVYDVRHSLKHLSDLITSTERLLTSYPVCIINANASNHNANPVLPFKMRRPTRRQYDAISCVCVCLFWSIVTVFSANERCDLDYREWRGSIDHMRLSISPPL